MSLTTLAFILAATSIFADVQTGLYKGKIVGSKKACSLNIVTVSRPEIVDYQGRVGLFVMQEIEYNTSLDSNGNQTTTLMLECLDNECKSFRTDLRMATDVNQDLVIYLSSNPLDQGASWPQYASTIPKYLPYMVSANSQNCKIELTSR